MEEQTKKAWKGYEYKGAICTRTFIIEEVRDVIVNKKNQAIVTFRDGKTKRFDRIKVIELSEIDLA